jgi:hypothetical protein
VNLYELMKQSDQLLFTEDDFELYRLVKNKIHSFVSNQFGVSAQNLHLTKPTFFSKLTANDARNVHDQYWQPHIDKHTYPAFHYTSLLYLNTFYKHFSGGRFMFIDGARNSSIEPRVGRVSAFTSGAENQHFVERVQKGVRYAITVSFTCDPTFAIQDPNPV